MIINAGTWTARPLAYCLLLIAFCSLSCSVPNLEEPECTQARDVVREFYSFHLANDMTFNPQNLENRKQFLTPELHWMMSGRSARTDPFTLSEDFPKAFRVGECHVVRPDKVVAFKVLLFWKTDLNSRQREIYAVTEKVGDKYLIKSVGEEKPSEFYDR